MMIFRTVKTVALAALLIGTAGCSANLAGAPQPAPGAGSSTAGMPPRPVRVLPAGGADEMICHLPQPFLTIWCDAPQVVVRDIPDGAAILLRQGDPIRVRGKETDRVCTVSLFARTPSGREWAITGDQCAETVGQSVYTFGGYRIGTVGAFLAPPAASSEPSFRMPAIRLDSRLLIQSTVTGSAAASERLVVRVDGGNVQSEREVYDDGRKLGGTVRSTFPMPQAGDRGAPAIADDRLVGVLRSAGDVTPASAVIQSLPGLDPTATLVVVR